MNAEVFAAMSADLFDAELAEHMAVTAAAREAVRGSFAAMLEAWTSCASGGGKILFFGNGGSADQAQHFAGELVIRYARDRAPVAALALAGNPSILTAGANDYGYDHVFARQVEALGRPGDLAVGLSTSGRSPNVLNALRAARKLGLATAGMTGRNGGATMRDCTDVLIAVPSDNTARVQEVHLLVGHMLCLGLERALRPIEA